MGGHDALILMAKAAVPGVAKTRLCPPLSPREAARFHACLVEDAAREAAKVRGVRRYLFFSPPGCGGRFRSPAFSGFRHLPQDGDDLGERMERAAREAFARGAGCVVIIGADCPALSANRIRCAFRELRASAGAVFGPAEDGGYYLVGAAAPAPYLFRGIAWGGAEVLAASVARCREAGVPYSLLPLESDVDTAEDLASLRRWLRSHPRPACPRTRGWIGDVLPRPGR